MSISSQVNKLSIELIPVERIKTNLGVALVFKIENYETWLSDFSKVEVKQAVVNNILSNELDEFSLNRAESGAPELKSKDYSEISISHSNGYFALYLSNLSVGIDIETPRKIPSIGTSYFLNPCESKDWSNEELIAIWCTKEALFKKQKGAIVDLRIDATVIEVGKMIKIEFKGEVFAFYLIQTQKYTLVYG